MRFHLNNKSYDSTTITRPTACFLIGFIQTKIETGVNAMVTSFNDEDKVKKIQSALDNLEIILKELKKII